MQGFHSKLNVAHELLQDTAIDDMLSLDTIASDFSAPTNTGMNSLSIIASILSAGIFLAGSVTGVVGVVASEVAIAAKAEQAAALAAARATRSGNEFNFPWAAAKADQLEVTAAAAGKQLSNAGGATRITGALGAGLVRLLHLLLEASQQRISRH